MVVITAAVIIILIGCFVYYRYRINKNYKKRREIYFKQRMQLMSDQLQKQDINMEAQRLEAAFNERIGIGRNLHDNISGSLVALRYLIEDKKNRAKSEKELNGLAMISEEVNAIYQEIRSYSHSLTASPSENVELFAYNIDDYLTEIKSKFDSLDLLQININYDRDLVRKKLPSKASEQLYYFIKECLSNIIKHAQAKSATISIDFTDTECITTVSDDGTGLTQTQKTNGIGLKNIMNRFVKLGGNVNLNPQEKGMAVVAQIPLHID